jgi:glycosyltransferase involved in cell wall biosynthesis
MEVALRMATERPVPVAQHPLNCLDRKTFYTELVNLKPRPSLSICITTYNRAAWLDINLRNLMRLWPEPHPDVEFVVCDNTSTDNTSDVVSPYLARSDFRYIRNAKNVGMLGNLRVTTAQAQGEYVWILGDDDLVCSGSIERVLNAIHSHTEIALLYLNYAYTRLADASAVTNIDSFLAESTPIVAPGPDRTGSVREICAMSENFFTAIYCLIFRRDHALRAYSQNTDGRPFSSLLTCIPTTYYVLNFMFKEPALWIGSPVVVVNMNVSWMKYAPLWILERIPEAYDLAERLGANRAEIDRWRLHNLPGLVRFLEEIFENDPVGNVKYFSMRRLASRLKGLDGIEDFIEPIRSIYAAAHEAGHPAAQTSVEEIFEGFGRTLGGAERGAT